MERFRLFGTTFEGDRIVQSPAREHARRRIVRSTTIAVAAPPLLICPLLWAGLTGWMLAGALLASAYLAWASYLGALGMFDALADPGAAIHGTGLGVDLAAHHVGPYALAIPVVIGVVYGALGGGVREFLKCRRMTTDQNVPSPMA